MKLEDISFIKNIPKCGDNFVLDYNGFLFARIDKYKAEINYSYSWKENNVLIRLKKYSFKECEAILKIIGIYIKLLG